MNLKLLRFLALQLKEYIYTYLEIFYCIIIQCHKDALPDALLLNSD